MKSTINPPYVLEVGGGGGGGGGGLTGASSPRVQRQNMEHIALLVFMFLLLRTSTGMCLYKYSIANSWPYTSTPWASPAFLEGGVCCPLSADSTSGGGGGGVLSAFGRFSQ